MALLGTLHRFGSAAGDVAAARVEDSGGDRSVSGTGWIAPAERSTVTASFILSDDHDPATPGATTVPPGGAAAHAAGETRPKASGMRLGPTGTRTAVIGYGGGRVLMVSDGPTRHAVSRRGSGYEDPRIGHRCGNDGVAAI